jgi:hypothetical protein
MLQDLPDDPAAAEFDDLPADADEATRQDLAERMIPYVRALRSKHPAGDSDAPRGARFARRTLDQAVKDLHNPAQLDVLGRIEVLLGTPPRT